MATRQNQKNRGFTLLELLIVIVIIGILISLIMVAAQEGVRRAEDKATQALITKLETAMNERIQAIMTSRVDPNQAHVWLASVFANTNAGVIPLTTAQGAGAVQRAYVIAMFDKLKMEVPDVFFPVPAPGTGSATGHGYYPINFAAQPWPGNPAVFPGTGAPLTNAAYVLPLGNAIANDNIYNDPTGTFGFSTSFGAWAPPGSLLYDPNYNITGTGIFGASYVAAGGLYKQLGYHPMGYDGADNDGDGNVDDMWEGSQLGSDGGLMGRVQAQLQSHALHPTTARSEMLYALLVESQGPFGSALHRDDFTDREVADTDGDGMLEFIDAWGQPLQFFRWPIFYASDIQRGTTPYSSPSEPRQQDPLDPNQQLVSSAWWSGMFNAGSPFGAGGQGSNESGAVDAFQHLFHLIYDPNGSWDRSQGLHRAEYFSKFLILSGGRDKVPGVGLLGVNYQAINPNIQILPAGYTLLPINSTTLIMLENQAASVDPNSRSGPFGLLPAGGEVDQYLQNYASGDDISNQNVTAYGGGVR